MPLPERVMVSGAREAVTAPDRTSELEPFAVVSLPVAAPPDELPDGSVLVATSPDTAPSVFNELTPPTAPTAIAEAAPALPPALLPPAVAPDGEAPPGAGSALP